MSFLKKKKIKKISEVFSFLLSTWLLGLSVENHEMIGPSDFWHVTQKELSDTARAKPPPLLPSNLYGQGFTALISLQQKPEIMLVLNLNSS